MADTPAPEALTLDVMAERSKSRIDIDPHRLWDLDPEAPQPWRTTEDLLHCPLAVVASYFVPGNGPQVIDPIHRTFAQPKMPPMQLQLRQWLEAAVAKLRSEASLDRLARPARVEGVANKAIRLGLDMVEEFAKLISEAEYADEELGKTDAWEQVADTMRDGTMASYRLGFEEIASFQSVTKDLRDQFEVWAVADRRDIAPEEYEERTPDNGLYYLTDSTNQAYIGWCAAMRLASPSTAQASLATSPTPPAPDGLADAVQSAWEQAHDLYLHAMTMCGDFKPSFVLKEMRGAWDRMLDPAYRATLDAALSDQPTSPVGVGRKPRVPEDVRDVVSVAGHTYRDVATMIGLGCSMNCREDKRRARRAVRRLFLEIAELRARLSSTPTPDAGRVEALRVTEPVAETVEDWHPDTSAMHALAAKLNRLRITRAARDVLAERRRQVEAEGWTPEHDDTHRSGELAAAAAVYAAGGGLFQITSLQTPSQVWPYRWECKLGTPRRNLEKAGALILAEIERMDRKAARNA